MAGINTLEARRKILLNTPHLTTESTNPLTFQTDISANLKDCKIYFEPIQEGTGDPSPDNVRPISGWDGVTIHRTGKSLIPNDIDFINGKYKPTNGVISGSVYVCCYFPVPKGTLYWLANVSGTSYVCLMDEPIRLGAKTYQVVTTSNHFGWHFDNSDGHPYMAMFGLGDGSVPLQTMIKNRGLRVLVGNDTSQAESSEHASLTIPFPQTIYGGYVDLVRGKVVETDYLLTVDENTVPYNVRRNTGGRVVGYYNLPYAGIKDAFTYYSHGQCIKSTTATYNYQVAGCVANEPYNSDAVRAAISASSDITTVEQYSDWIASVAPLQIAYKLATPITHQLTPQIIKTLKGVNNIWSDANGSVEVKFWKH